MWGWWLRIVRFFFLFPHLFFSFLLPFLLLPFLGVLLMTPTHTDNARPEVGLVQRRESPIIGLRNFNNWIKSVLITKFAHPALVASPSGRGKVLDMGCGKGGDLAKWSKARVREYVGLGAFLPFTSIYPSVLKPSLRCRDDRTAPQTSPPSRSTKPARASNPSTAASTPSSPRSTATPRP